MKRSTISFAFLGTFLCTVFVLQWWQNTSYPLWVWLSITVLGIVLYGTCVLSKKAPLGIVVFAGMIGAQMAFLMVMRTTHAPTPFTIDTYAQAETVQITGTVIEEPDRRPLETKYTVEVQQLQTESGTILFPIEGRVLVSDKNGYPEYAYGDTVSAKGKLEKPTTIEAFAYDRYLSRYGIYAVMYRAQIELVRAEPSWSFYGKLFSFKEVFEDRINRLFPEPHASFMAGLLTGTRKGIPDVLTQAFNTVGLTHIIAISGYNISIIIVIIGNALFWLPLKQRFVPAIIAIVLFTIFVGASAAVVRAAIMGILGLIAVRMERLPHARLSVLWTMFFMVAWNPKYLWYDSGFQLSFAAVIGLMEISPLIERYFHRIPKAFGIRESLLMTMSAQITTLPLSALFFERFSVIAPLANILAAPVIPLAMLLGVSAVSMSIFSQFLGLSIAYIAWLLLEWIILVATVFSHIPFASIPLSMGWLLVTVYYGLLLFWKTGWRVRRWESWEVRRLFS